MRTTPVILIVDDEIIVRNILAKMLHVLGYVTLQATNSTEAQGMIRQHQPDLILLDMIMPGVDSMEIVKFIRADASMSNMAIILISGSNNLDAVADFIDAGINDFLPKPFNKTLLTLKLKTCLQQMESSVSTHTSEQAIDEFCRDLSHDLNNALTGIMMTAEVLLMSATSAQNKQYIEDIIESTEQVSSLIKTRRQAFTDQNARH